MQITPQWAKALENMVLNMQITLRPIPRANRSTYVSVYFKLHLDAPWTASDLLGACFVVQVTGCDGSTYYCVY